MALWLVMRGNDPYPLEPGRDVTIGRGRSCDLSLYSTQLSREHARIRWDHGAPVLFDLDSLNGCFVGVDRVLRHGLSPGDAIRLGDLTLLVVESEGPPPPLPISDAEDPPTEISPALPDQPLEVTPSAVETQILQRQGTVHQKLFAWREFEWLLTELTPAEFASIRDARFSNESLPAWAQQYGEGPLYRMLEVGVLTARDPLGTLDHSGAVALSQGLSLSPRGGKLRRHQPGGREAWSEMAFLRHRLRQEPTFKALRWIARAYRPGGTLTELRASDVIYELQKVYAADLPAEVLINSLRRLLCYGVFAPAIGARRKAWFPVDWSAPDVPVVVAPRGYAVLEGFRIEEDEE